MKLYVYNINCDCGSYWDTRVRPNKTFLKCRGCGKLLGDMQVTFIGRFEGESEFDILDKARKAPRPRSLISALIPKAK